MLIQLYLQRLLQPGLGWKSPETPLSSSVSCPCTWLWLQENEIWRYYSTWSLPSNQQTLQLSVLLMQMPSHRSSSPCYLTVMATPCFALVHWCFTGAHLLYTVVLQLCPTSESHGDLLSFGHVSLYLECKLNLKHCGIWAKCSVSEETKKHTQKNGKHQQNGKMKALFVVKHLLDSAMMIHPNLDP